MIFDIPKILPLIPSTGLSINRMQLTQGVNDAHKVNRAPKLARLPMGPLTGSITALWDDFCHNKVFKNFIYCARGSDSLTGHNTKYGELFR